MELNRAEAFENRTGALPDGKLRVDDLGELQERGEVAVVDPEAPQQFPDPLNRVEIGAVGRKKVQVEGRDHVAGAKQHGEWRDGIWRCRR